ncbi:hypothetical protein [Phormidium tenue]|jgi:hypothetical protein|uniref:Type I restriction enzyme R protein N-terminal domain-containing protein n=1 Tax=Phormidium tenue FACHB-1050 TaxID=2692857 RepID=A0ABR8CIG7_9CYAN|nr:hypothetical protein [Phormidium tenue]MBD2319745.1 hypothetical protein [Phormidium tenue FACHB-1050]
MSYSEFTLESVQTAFDLTIAERANLLNDSPLAESSEFLNQLLKEFVPLALAMNTEKARSELIIAPILVEVRKKYLDKASLFSGVELNIDRDSGLNGVCDFLLSRSPSQLMLKAPVVVVVEAKKENINGALGQCIAEMWAAKLFNQQHENDISVIYGAATTGNDWKFLRLSDRLVEIDLTEYQLSNIDKILGILSLSFQ